MERKSKTIILWIIENEKWKILMTERIDPKIKDAHRKRDIPWWKNESGENFEETIVREIQEETWLKVRDIKFLSEKYSKVREHEEYIQDTLLYCCICRVDSWLLKTADPKIGQMLRISIEDALALDVLETTLFFLKIYADIKKK